MDFSHYDQLVLPAALAIYLCIGMAYALGVFWFQRAPSSAGGWDTWLVLAALYFLCVLAAGYRPARSGGQLRHVRRPYMTSPFWLIWVILCLNVVAGIGIFGIAPSMLQDIFGTSAADAAQFTVVMSLCSVGGALCWASLSDRIGRRATFTICFFLGMALYALMPVTARSGNQVAFVLAACLIVSVHGGAFATVPAYVADVFGPQSARAIYGRVLTAWPAAAILAPVLMRYIRDRQRLIGVPWPLAYDITMYILAAILLLALVANKFMRPVVAGSGEAP
jgi:MFS family permease